MTTQNFDKYTFELYDLADGGFGLKVYNNQARKEWKRLVHHYRFRTVNNREEWIEKFKSSWQKNLDWKDERKAQRVNFVNPAKVGDILDSSWGYEQTNIDFYEVVSVKGKMVIIRELCQKRNESGAWLQGTCIPVPGSFVKNSKPIKKIVKPSYDNVGYYVSLNSYASAYLWDGKERHYTSYA